MSYIPFLNVGREKVGITVLKSPAPEADRRKEPRHATNGSARVHVPFLSEPQTFSARVLDVSKSGLCLQLSVPLAPGTLIQIELESAVATGAVRHCRKDGEQYSMGIQLDTVLNQDETV